MSDVFAGRREAERLLSTCPPAEEATALIDTPLDMGWAWLFHWTLERNLSGDMQVAPPPGMGPIVVVKSTADAHYLGSGPVESEIIDLAARRDARAAD